MFRVLLTIGLFSLALHAQAPAIDWTLHVDLPFPA